MLDDEHGVIQEREIDIFLEITDLFQNGDLNQT